MHVETERKFLVEGEFKSLATHSSRIRQGYIASGKGRTVRVRTRSGKGFLTIKGPSADGGLSRLEFETEISLDDALSLLWLCEPGLIDKTRYLIPSTDGRHTWEVDEFHGENEGLLLAEIELESGDEGFEKPAFVGQEVTGDRRYYNSHLRDNPYRLWGAHSDTQASQAQGEGR